MQSLCPLPCQFQTSFSLSRKQVSQEQNLLRDKHKSFNLFGSQLKIKYRFAIFLEGILLLHVVLLILSPYYHGYMQCISGIFLYKALFDFKYYCFILSVKG